MAPVASKLEPVARFFESIGKSSEASIVRSGDLAKAKSMILQELPTLREKIYAADQDPKRSADERTALRVNLVKAQKFYDDLTHVIARKRDISYHMR